MKTFITPYTTLINEPRFDPNYFYLLDIIQLKDAKFPVVELRSILAEPPKYGAGYSAIDGEKGKDVRYIRITDIDEFGNLIDETWKTAEDPDEKYLLTHNDIVIARSGNTVGKSFIYKEDMEKAIYAGYMIKFVIDKNKALPDFVFYFTQTQFYKTWIDAKRRPSGQPNINAEEYQSLKLPLPPIKTQQKIVEIMQSAYQKKQEMEQEAEELLEGIQNMIFTSLGIEKREREDSLTKVISSVEVQNNRFDPFYYVHPQDTKSSTMYEEKTLGEIAELKKGKSISKKNINSGEYPVIAGGQSSPYSIDRYNYEGNVITVSASGAYSGYVWYHDYPIFASDCTVIKSKNEEEVSTHYIYCVLRAKQRFIYNMQQGAGQPHVYASDLEILNIPIPSKEKQKEISSEVQKRIKENKTLRKTAKEVIEQAKAQVEEIILGK